MDRRKLDCIRVGVVGCGGIADSVSRWAAKVSQVRLVACCDLLEQKARAFSDRHHIPRVCSSYEELLGEDELDAVYLSVPHHLHYSMISMAVEAGKAVLAEKPLTRTLEEGLKLTSLMGRQKVGVNYQYRYDSGCHVLAGTIREGSLGKVRSVRINVPWHRNLSYFDNASWHRSVAEAGGGTLITQASHFLDIVFWALAEAPLSAMGYAASLGFDVEVDTLVHGVVETAGGTLISITSSMVAASQRPATIEVYGDRGTILYRGAPRASVKVIGAKASRQRPPERGRHPLQRSLVGFARWVLEDRPYLIPAREALPVLAAVDGIYRSAKSETRVTIDTVATMR